MTRSTMRILTLAALAAAVLAGCGRQGELERPRPLVGKGPTPSADRVTRDEAAARARADGRVRGDPQAPQSIDEVRNQGVTPRERTDIPTSDPNAPRQGSLMPDPVGNPSAPQ